MKIVDQGWLITVGLSQEGSSSLKRRVQGETARQGGNFAGDAEEKSAIKTLLFLLLVPLC